MQTVSTCRRHGFTHVVHLHVAQAWKPTINKMGLSFFILDSRCVLHPAPVGAWVQNISQIKIVVAGHFEKPKPRDVFMRALLACCSASNTSPHDSALAFAAAFTVPYTVHGVGDIQSHRPTAQRPRSALLLTHAHTHTYRRAHNMYTHARTHTHAHARTRTRTHTHAHARTHVCA